MKKKLLLMIISILTISIVAFTLTGCAGNIGNQDESKANFVQGTSPFETLKEFVTKFPDRTATQTFGEDDKTLTTAKWIADKFSEFGYIPQYENGIDSFDFENVITGKQAIGYNVAFKKESPSDKKVIIGASYDNVTSYSINNKIIGGDGTYNNGVGIATLIETARVLKDKTFNFDIEFVAFGAKEAGLVGSSRYISNQIDKENIILMIDFDRNAIGDYVYMYSSEANTKHNKFFYDIARENNLCIADLPSYRSPSFGGGFNNSLYTTEANWTDGESFLAQGINIISFLSMNFKPFEAVEKDGSPNIAYTLQDNFDYVVNRLGGNEKAEQFINKQINSAISTVVYAFENKDFVNVMSVSSANGGLDALANAEMWSYISLGLLLGTIILIVVLYNVLKSTCKEHDVYINTIYGRVNTRTGKLDGMGNIPNNTPNNNVGNVFGNEFDSNNNSSNSTNGENANNEAENINAKTRDKSKDIFGDY